VYLFDRSIIESTVAMVIQFGLLNNKRYYLRPSRLHNIYYTKQTLCPWTFVRRSTSPPPNNVLQHYSKKFSIRSIRSFPLQRAYIFILY